MKTYASKIDGSEIWRTYSQKAIADIQSELKISASDARAKLEASTIDNPVTLSDVQFWVEFPEPRTKAGSLD